MFLPINKIHVSHQLTPVCFLVLVAYLLSSAQANECLTACADTSDYQHPTSFLHFSRSHYPENTLSTRTKNSSTNGHWRHRYDIVITRDGPQTTIFDHLGYRHTFSVSADGLYIPLSPTSGTLSLDKGNYRWLNDEGVDHEFQGSYLTQITSPDNETLKLQYAQRKLASISDAHGEAISLNYHNGTVQSLTTSQGTLIELKRQACPSPTDTHPETCDTDQHPLDNFNSQAAQSGVISVDARPASCNSYFIDYFGATRGSQIEQALATLAPYRHMQTTVRSFPIIDFINNDEWIVVRSRDLASPSFNDEQAPNTLFYRLMRDGADIQNRFLTPLADRGVVSAEEQGLTTTLEAGTSPHNIVLQLVIRDNIASSAQWHQIARARNALAQRYNIRLQVVLIP